jgi:hypothetical protein
MLRYFNVLRVTEEGRSHHAQAWGFCSSEISDSDAISHQLVYFEYLAEASMPVSCVWSIYVPPNQQFSAIWLHI